MGATYVAASEQVTPGANKTILGVFNAAGSPVSIAVKRVWATNYFGVTAGTGVMTMLELNRVSAMPMASAVTASILSYDSTNVLSTYVLAMTSCVSFVETSPRTYQRLIRQNEEQVSPLASGFNYWGCMHTLSLMADPGYGDQANGNAASRPIILGPGEGIHIKNVTSTVVNRIDAWIEFEVLSSIPGADTYTVIATFASFVADKFLFSLMNATGSPDVVKIKKVWALNNQITGVTGVYHMLEMKAISSHVPGTAHVPVKHHLASPTLSTFIIPSYNASAVTEVATIGRFMWSADEAAIGGATSDELECLYPLMVIYDCYGEVNAQPLTLRAGEGFGIKDVYASGTRAGFMEIFTEFTVTSA